MREGDTWNDPFRQGGVPMFINQQQVRSAARRVDAAAGEVPVGAFGSAVDQGVDAVPASKTAQALDEVGADLRVELTRFSEGCQQWALTAQACVSAYAETDAAVAARADQLSEAVG